MDPLLMYPGSQAAEEGPVNFAGGIFVKIVKEEY